MEWRKSYLDAIFVPLGLLLTTMYHAWLWYKIRTQPHQTIIGINAASRRLWVLDIMRDNDKKNLMAVQSLRNSVMSTTVMANTCILICCGLAAIINSSYNNRSLFADSYGAHGEFIVALKYITIFLVFLFTFLCYSLSIRFFGQVNFLINTPSSDYNNEAVTSRYVCEMLDKGFGLNILGNRLFYVGLPLLLWIFGPVFMFLCSATMVPLLYNLDVVYGVEEKVEKTNGEVF